MVIKTYFLFESSGHNRTQPDRTHEQLQFEVQKTLDAIGLKLPLSVVGKDFPILSIKGEANLTILKMMWSYSRVLNSETNGLPGNLSYDTYEKVRGAFFKKDPNREADISGNAKVLVAGEKPAYEFDLRIDLSDVDVEKFIQDLQRLTPRLQALGINGNAHAIIHSLPEAIKTGSSDGPRFTDYS